MPRFPASPPPIPTPLDAVTPREVRQPPDDFNFARATLANAEKATRTTTLRTERNNADFYSLRGNITVDHEAHTSIIEARGGHNSKHQ